MPRHLPPSSRPTTATGEVPIAEAPSDPPDMPPPSELSKAHRPAAATGIIPVVFAVEPDDPAKYAEDMPAEYP